MNRLTNVSLFLGSVILASSCTTEKEKENKQPNVILFLTDDQGFGDLSCHGNPHLHTTNIDNFAQNGVEFKNFYVTPACAPTRAGLLTGRYNFRTKNTDVGDTTSYMSSDEITIAEVLKANGYATGMFGKWHLGENYPLNPGNQGFEEVLFHHFCNITDDFPIGTSYFDPHLFHNGKLEKYDGYCMDIYTNEAIKFIENSVKDNKPFFAFIPTTLAHVPLQVDEKYYKEFLDKGINEETARVYGMIQSIDENFGRLLNKLEEMNLRENTIIIFTSDNGPSSHHLDRYQADLKGLKGFVYEGGVKVPFFIQFPERIKTPQKVDLPTAYIDIFPTILDFCNISNPEGITIDGKSLVPLAIQKDSDWKERNIFIQWRKDMPMEPYRHFMVRNNRYKLIQEDESTHSKQRLQFLYSWCKENGYKNYKLSDDLKFELYDLKKDPSERNNIANEHPEIVESMKRDYISWYSDVFSTRGHNRPVLKFNNEIGNSVYFTSNFWLEPREWKMIFETSGTYDVTVHWGNLKKDAESVHFEIAGQHFEEKTNKNNGSYTFSDIEISNGYHKFQSWINNKHTKLSVTTEIVKVK